MTRTITQTQLCTGTAAVLDALEVGENFIITRNGNSVGELRPVPVPRHVLTSDLQARLARFAGVEDAATERAEIDAVFGEDRVDRRVGTLDLPARDESEADPVAT
ncbi:type II toxin-antitoxin system Phd/YefM family antitoxin [Nocardia sp. NPDC058640]|uniref:type II toxin-antitoxin system Phd/YefM family antitoxin n=1 Tax=Nocardia sp. NPDC058640 TaxID=3346571 RepID=UPI00364D0F34